MKDTFNTVNPRTNQKLTTFSYMPYEQAEGLVVAAHSDFEIWKNFSFTQRKEVILELASVLEAASADLSMIMGLEMGKLPSEARAEITKCVQICHYYAENAESLLRNQDVAESPYEKAQVRFAPMGVIFSIMPWNFPLLQLIRFAAPSLMAGNIILLKHSDITAGTAVLIEMIFNRVKSPVKLLRNLQVSHAGAEKVIAHPLVRGVTFTGSTEGGRKVAVNAAANLKKHVLELGGSDPYIVLQDADIAKAAKICAKSRLQNAGQSCVAAKRFIVQRNVLEDFLTFLKSEMSGVELAPLAAKRFQQLVHNQVNELIRGGAKLELGGGIPSGEGSFYPPTILVSGPEQTVQEEIFGPVAVVTPVESFDEALQMANHTPYGLGGAIFTQDAEKVEIAMRTLNAGFIVANDFVKSDAHIPFGGVKDSGYGRELGAFGLMEFVNIKTCAWGKV